MDKQPILSREEVLKIVEPWMKEPGFFEFEANYFYAAIALIEAAVLERVCGEPVKWQARIPGSTWFDVKSDLIDRMRDEGAEVRALYALTRSKP